MFNVKHEKLTWVMRFICPKILNPPAIAAVWNFVGFTILRQIYVVKNDLVPRFCLQNIYKKYYTLIQAVFVNCFAIKIIKQKQTRNGSNRLFDLLSAIFCNFHLWFQSLSTELKSSLSYNVKHGEMKSCTCLHK